MLTHPAPRPPLPRVVGWAALGVLAVFLAAGTVSRAEHDAGLAALGASLALAGGAAVMLGRLPWALPAAIVSSAGIAVLGNGVASNLGWFGLAVLAGWFAVTAPWSVLWGYAAAAGVLLVFEWALTGHDPGWAAWIGGTAFSVVGCYLGRRQRDLVEQLRAAQAGLAQRAQAEERNRIARELHDVIAHSLTVSLLHVSSARLALDDDRDEAARALDEAERLGRASLDEVRHAVGLLRRDGESDPTTPLPGSLDVPALVERFRVTGADVRASLDGDLGAVPPIIGLAAYRIVQEALTNAMKHAPGTHVTVCVAVSSDAVRLAVDSAGRPGSGSGLGLVGMRERAESLGGTCTAGPGGSGWLVRAELPLERER